MAYDRFLIAPINSGLQTDLRPWLIPDDAFAQLQNAYVFRGRVRKRFGSRLMGTGWSSPSVQGLYSRLAIPLGNTNGSGNISVSVPGTEFNIGQAFSVGNEIFTVYQIGTPGVMLTTGASTVHTYNTTTGAVVINGAAATTETYFYPGQPVMGLCNYESGPINNQPSYAFDTQFAYVFSGGFWSRSGSPIWHGTYTDFFWTCNWQSIVISPAIMFVTNFFVVNYNGAGSANDDPIWYFDGTTWTAAIGVNGFYFMPTPVGGPVGAPRTGPFIQTARIILPFKNRLILLNTVENNNADSDPTLTTNKNFVNRCRYSHNGSPFSNNAWYEANQIDTNGIPTGIADGGGFLDASTEEQIVGAEFIKDRLVVYFERSTWELAYTGNEVLPFVWQKINTELGSESTFSIVPFDKVVLGIGNVGIHACNGSNVERIDKKIPDEIFDIRSSGNSIKQVGGIRDYYVEMVYWTFPAENFSGTFPNQVLLFNYRDGSWALNDDCITCFGYYEQQPFATWGNTSLSWGDINSSWESGTLSANARQVIAGNQQGYVFIIDADVSRNAAAMQINNIVASGSGINVSITNHTLVAGDYISIEYAQGITFPNGQVIFMVNGVINANTININPTSFTGIYTGGGLASRVSMMQILSKQWNPYVSDGSNVYLAKIDFGVERTSSGQVTVDYYASASQLSMVNEAISTGTIMGTNVLETYPYNPLLYPFEQVQDRLWHQVYFQGDGECIQIYIYLSPSQMTNSAIAWSDFQLEGIVIYTMSTADRLQ
jgi:hypothetical protein